MDFEQHELCFSFFPGHLWGGLPHTERQFVSHGQIFKIGKISVDPPNGWPNSSQRIVSQLSRFVTGVSGPAYGLNP